MILLLLSYCEYHRLDCASRMIMTPNFGHVGPADTYMIYLSDNKVTWDMRVYNTHVQMYKY